LELVLLQHYFGSDDDGADDGDGADDNHERLSHLLVVLGGSNIRKVATAPPCDIV
jgi:hypothetical protein